MKREFIKIYLPINKHEADTIKAKLNAVIREVYQSIHVERGSEEDE